MPFRVKTLAEPFSEHAKAQVPILAESDEYRRLRHDLERYTKGEILGRSYLIGGHRGSGKTMMVHHAVEDLIRSSQTLPNRPLFVRLHGPDLLPPATVEEKPTEPAKPPAAVDGATADKDKAAGAATAAGAKAEATKKPTAAANKTRTADDTELEAVLIQMVKALYRHVSSEYRRCYREEILRRSDSIVRDDLLEVAAQFDFELTDFVTPGRLRAFWHRIGAFRRGILFTVDRSTYKAYSPLEPAQAAAPVQLPPPPPMVATDVGLQEILVLSNLSEAYRITSGKLEDISRRLSSDKDSRSSSISTAYELKNLLAPVAGLLSGGFVGVSIGSANPFAAVLLGLVTGGVVSLAFSFKSERTRNREDTLESVFTKDRSVTTLSSVVPLLVDRLKQIGLAPIFVIDELDKVENLESRMTNLVRHLKFLVTENSFSCFLVDRRYFSYLNRQSTQTAYAREYTYFSDRLLILYTPSQLRRFITSTLETVTSGQTGLPVQPTDPTETDKQELEKISYVVLFRARMHPIDLRRQLDSLTAKPGFTLSDFFPTPRYRFEILMQVAIEWLLDGDDVRVRMSGDPYYRQMAYDTLYYVPRLWEDAGSDKPQVPGYQEFGTTERKPGLVLDNKKFAEYLTARSAGEGQPKSDSKPASKRKAALVKDERGGRDFEFLVGKVRELLRYLSRPKELIDEIARSERKFKPSQLVLNEIPTDVAFRLLIQDGNKPNYRWLFDVSGNQLQPPEVVTLMEEVVSSVTDIRQFMAELDQLKLSGDLQVLAENNIIPRPSELKKTVMPALDRLDKLLADRNEYGNMSADQAAVKEFANTLSEFEPNIKAALLCAAAFAPEITLSAPSPGAALRAALEHLNTTLQLTATREADLFKLNSLLSSAPGELPKYREMNLELVIDKVGELLNQPKATDEASEKNISEAWDLAKSRFSLHFQDGTARFDPLYLDLFTMLRKKGPHHELPNDFSQVTARTWSKLLKRSLSGKDLPEWLAVAAAIKLGVLQLAERLARRLTESDPLPGQWLEEVRRRLTTDTSRVNALIVTHNESSLAHNWQPSAKNGALLFTMKETMELKRELDRLDVLGSHYQQLLAVELPGNTQTLSKIADLPPLRAVATISSSTPKDIEGLLSTGKLSYFLTEPISSLPTGSVPIVVAPKTIDELIEVSLRSPSTIPTA